MRRTKTSLRTCLGCGLEADKRELVRIVRGPDGDVFVDPTSKKSGRGAYVCPKEACFEAAVRKNRLGHALRAVVKEEDIERLRIEFEQIAGSDARFGSGR
ncbi:YlxR family protein [Coriobacteriia bacterium Es71-Z0120]|uniref:RNase P modulator RnpM n=1 Tax=Parvivirga hydrogeniphila TaxID=2939460 RepID=UPI002260F329|nr:YlxR family protein [Parvivirga hydrogeniphila]MCL4079599.1 YlxR family protein [Parvivirga hydrogeniphila]